VAQITPPGVLAVEKNNGYVFADDVNVWGWLNNSDIPNLGTGVQLTQMSHNLCLFDNVQLGGIPISSIALDPINFFVYFTYLTFPSITRVQYDGTGSVQFPYNFTGNTQLLLDYNKKKLFLLPAFGAQSFNIYDLTTNTSVNVTLAAPITGGLTLDINSGKIYAAIQHMVMSYDPTNAAITTVYTNADYTIRGITLDSQGFLFIAADRATAADSQLLVIPISLPAGTTGSPTALTPTKAGAFVSMTNAHCSNIGCAQCGILRPGFITSSSSIIIYSMTLTALFVFLV